MSHPNRAFLTAGKSALPTGFEMAVGTHGWLISIEGSPSVRAFIEVRADLETDACYIVPGIVRAEPGIFHTQLPLVHWRPDLRAE
ncbi:hypothetical protein ACLMAJ_37350 [Nocardia sp. KC 131]|uniref:hypothetical protein n=1 Tax=Nocardia arseniciresistens TaxID=3392119 RepID=UPI00398E7E9A